MILFVLAIFGMVSKGVANFSRKFRNLLHCNRTRHKSNDSNSDSDSDNTKLMHVESDVKNTVNSQHKINFQDEYEGINGATTVNAHHFSTSESVVHTGNKRRKGKHGYTVANQSPTSTQLQFTSQNENDQQHHQQQQMIVMNGDQIYTVVPNQQAWSPQQTSQMQMSQMQQIQPMQQMQQMQQLPDSMDIPMESMEPDTLPGQSQ